MQMKGGVDDYTGTTILLSGMVSWEACSIRWVVAFGQVDIWDAGRGRWIQGQETRR